MDSIITTNLKEITLTSGLLNITSSKGDIVIDVKQMLKEPINSDNAYFNATRVSDIFKNKPLSEFMRLKSTKEYIEVLEKEFSLIMGKSHNQKIKTHFTKRGRETEDNKGTFGTYLHNELFFEYLSWCDVSFRREMHKIFKQIITHSNELKIERSNTKIHFKPLTEAIRDIFIPAQESDKGKQFAYSNLSNLINIKVLGSTAKKYREDNGIDEDVCLRDVVTKEELEAIDRLELDLHGYIKYANITDYEILRNKLECWRATRNYKNL